MRLTKNELSYLGKIYQGTNPLALFSSIKETLHGDEEKTLEAKGVLKGGKPAEEAHKLLNIAAEPQKCTRLVLKDGVYFIEKYAYKTKDGHVFAENDGGDVIFSQEKQMDEILFQLSQWTGASDCKTFDLEMTVSNHELPVLFAVADLRRETELLSYLGKETENMISLGRIREQLQNPVKGSLTSILTGHYDFPVPNEEETVKILESLTAKKIAAFNAGYTLVGPYEEFARSFLIPQSIVLLETFHLTEKKEILGAGVLCIWAGMREILSLVFREGEVEIASISGRQLLKMMEDFLNCPDVL
jgi:hypothetical protein